MPASCRLASSLWLINCSVLCACEPPDELVLSSQLVRFLRRFHPEAGLTPESYHDLAHQDPVLLLAPPCACQSRTGGRSRRFLDAAAAGRAIPDPGGHRRAAAALRRAGRRQS